MRSSAHRERFFHQREQCCSTVASPDGIFNGLGFLYRTSIETLQRTAVEFQSYSDTRCTCRRPFAHFRERAARTFSVLRPSAISVELSTS